MILVDANILIYAYDTSSPHHKVARDWLDARLNGNARVGLPWPSLLAFVRLVTNRRIYPDPLPIAEAWQLVSDWLDCQAVWCPAPTDRHAAILGQFLLLPSVNHNLVPDAHLATLAIEHGLTLCSADGDFARFPDLRWLNPVSGQTSR